MAPLSSYPGLHRVQITQKNGTRRSYYYAWRGGPKLTSPFGSPAFSEEFSAALRTRDQKLPDLEAGTLAQVVRQYQSSPAFLRLAPVTRQDYSRHLQAILKEFGDLPIDALDDPAVRPLFIDWRDKLMHAVQDKPNSHSTGTRMADYAISVLKLLLSFALDRRLIEQNHALSITRLHNKSRVDALWTEDKLTAIRAQCKGGVLLALEIALETGQRQADILALRWEHYTGSAFRFVQSKTGRPVSIPLTQRLQEILSKEPRKETCPWICHTRGFERYTSDGFRTNFHRARTSAKITDLTFHDLRGTAVTRLAEAGASVPMIASITGHSIQAAEGILQKHYLSRTQKLAEEGIRLLELSRKPVLQTDL